jgi:hypothetical protein
METSIYPSFTLELQYTLSKWTALTYSIPLVYLHPGRCYRQSLWYLLVRSKLSLTLLESIIAAAAAAAEVADRIWT